MDDKEKLAEQIRRTWHKFSTRLYQGGKYPTKQFYNFFSAVKAYTEEVKDDELIHKDIASIISSLCDVLRVERKRIPGTVLFDADRLSYMLFSGYDPYFDGFEPPGL